MVVYAWQATSFCFTRLPQSSRITGAKQLQPCKTSPARSEHFRACFVSDVTNSALPPSRGYLRARLPDPPCEVRMAAPKLFSWILLPRRTTPARAFPCSYPFFESFFLSLIDPDRLLGVPIFPFFLPLPQLEESSLRPSRLSFFRPPFSRSFWRCFHLIRSS